jgi:hypothetical protein
VCPCRQKTGTVIEAQRLDPHPACRRRGASAWIAEVTDHNGDPLSASA